MKIQQTIENKIHAALSPSVLEIENESHRHGGPATESHFKLTVVSDQFDSLNRVQRHQRVYAVLADELQGEVHALALHLHSPQEWAEQGGKVPDSPDCRGGSKVSAD